MPKVIELSKGYVALVDDEDYEKVSALRWCLWTGPNGTVYPRRKQGDRKSGRRDISMHCFITGEKWTDHITHDLQKFKIIDNRKSNLRTATPSQNNANRRKRPGTSSKYKGVGWHKKTQQWSVAITVNYKYKWLGRYTTEKEAAEAYDTAAIKHFGEFALTNRSMYPQDFREGNNAQTL